MKTKNLLISSLVAAAAMSVSALAEDLTLATDSASQSLSDNKTYGNITVNDSVAGTITISADNKNLTASTKVEIGSGATLEIKQNTCDLISLSGLTGSGTLTLSKASPNNWGGAAILNGDGSTFSGTINVWNGTSATTSVTSYSQGLHLNSQNAAKGATVNLGKFTSLVVSATATEIAGLSSTDADTKVVSNACTWSTSRNDSGNPYNTTDLAAFSNNDTTTRTLTISGDGTYSYAGMIGAETNSSSLNIVKSGTGTQTLSGTVYAGTITVSSGTLDLSGATVSVSSAIANSGTVKVSTDTHFLLGKFVADANGNYTVISNSNGGSITGWDSLQIGNFKVGNTTLTSGDTRSFNVSESGKVNFGSKNLVWNGTSGSSTWDTQTQNWNESGEGTTSTATKFYQMDNVTFDNTATVKTVSLGNDANLAVGTMTVSGGDYTISTTGTGTASVTGNKLTIASGASLQIGNSSNSTPATNFSFSEISVAGTLKFKNAPQTWSSLALENGGKLYIVDGPNTSTSNPYNLTINDLKVNGSATIASATNKSLALKNVSGTGDLSITGNDASVWGGNLSVRIEALNNYSGTMSLSYSAAQNTPHGAGGLAVSVAAANIGTTAKINVGEGVVLSLDGVGTGTTAATVSGTGTISVVGSVSDFTGNTAQSTIKLSNVSDTSTFTGAVELKNVQAIVSGNDPSAFANASKIVLNNGCLHFNNDAATFDKNIEVGNDQNGYIRSYGGNKISSSKGATISGNVSGTGTLTSSDDGDVTFTGTVEIGKYVGRKSGGISAFTGTTTTIGTLQVNQGTTARFGGNATTISTTLTGAGKIETVSGLGTLTISGENTDFTGTTTINAGMLVMTSAKALGTSTTTIANGGTLKISVAEGANMGAVTFNEGAKFAIDLSGKTGISENTALTIITSTALNFNGVNNANISDSAAIDAYFDATNSSYGTFGAISDYLRTWTISNNTLSLTLSKAIPEPSMFGVLAGLGALAIVGSRRRRKNVK